MTIVERPTTRHQRRRGWPDPFTLVLAVATVVVAYYAIFRLPFRFPSSAKIVSSSLVFGFNNSVAIASLVALLGVVALVCLWRRRRDPPDAVPAVAFDASAPRIRWRVFAVVAGAHALLTLLMYVKARRSMWWVIDFEASHFLWRLNLIEVFGLRPYLDFQHEYGPGLLYPGTLFHRLLAPAGVSLEASYYASYLALNLVGLWAIRVVLNAAVMPRGRKEIAFCLLGAAGLTPYMGLNGSLVRYIPPFLSVLVGHRVLSRPHGRGWAFAVVLGLAAVNILLSPEIGLAFAIAWTAYCLFVGTSDRSAATVGLSALAVAILAGVATLPREYSGTLFRFSAGANNFPLLPAAHIVFFITVLFLTVPPLLADALTRRGRQGALLLAMAALCVVMIPGGLGRADPPHVLYYSLGVALLLFVRLANRPRRAFAVYAALYAVVIIGGLHLSNARAFYGFEWQSFHPRSLLAFLRREEPPVTAADLARLDKYPPLGLPFCSYASDRRTMEYLWSHRKLAPEYYCGIIGVYTEAELSRKLADLRRHEYVLMPKGWERPWLGDGCTMHREIIRTSFIYPVRLPCKHEALETDSAIKRAIAQDYQTAEEIGRYVVLKRTTTRETGG